jgi:hypothetical protein
MNAGSREEDASNQEAGALSVLIDPGVTLLHHRPDPLVTNGGLDAVAAGIEGEEDHADATDDILNRNVSHGRKDAAVGGVVAVVAEHEQMAGGTAKTLVLS